MQWIALIALIALVIVAIWVATGGGDFNPFNDDPIARSAVRPPSG